MLGHLKAEDFTNLIEGNELSSQRRSHLKSCARCMDAFVSAQSLHAEMTKSVVDDEDIPEPDWFQFRSDVRTAMLSRAAQRQPRLSNWRGWLMQPALTWGLAVAFAAGLTAGLMIWNPKVVNFPATEVPATEIANLESGNTDITEDAVIDLGMTTWSQTSVFDELSQLNDEQSERLQRILEADAEQAPATR